MSESMPNTLRTDTFRSGGPATAGASACETVSTFMKPPGRAAGAASKNEPYSRSRRWRKSASDQLLAAQRIVCLDDLAQFLLRRTVAAVGVGAMALHQVLVAVLDRRLRRSGVEVQRVQRLQRQRIVARRLLGAAGAARAFFPHGARFRVDGFVDMRGLRAARPHFPGRAMADHLRGAEFGERIVVHAFEIIVGRVVVAHVLLAEHEELALAIASLRGLEFAGGGAAGMAARRPFLDELRRIGRAARLDANFIEKRRIQIHDPHPVRHAPLSGRPTPRLPNIDGITTRGFRTPGSGCRLPYLASPGARGKPGLTAEPGLTAWRPARQDGA